MCDWISTPQGIYDKIHTSSMVQYSLVLIPGSLAWLAIPTASGDCILADGGHGVIAVLAECGVGGRGDGLLLLGKGEPPKPKPTPSVVAHGSCGCVRR